MLYFPLLTKLVTWVGTVVSGLEVLSRYDLASAKIRPDLQLTEVKLLFCLKIKI
jgi:hypothetical protein